MTTRSMIITIAFYRLLPFLNMIFKLLRLTVTNAKSYQEQDDEKRRRRSKLDKKKREREKLNKFYMVQEG